MQTAYFYDEVTKEYLGTKDIQQDKFLKYNLPAFATWVVNVLTPGANEIAIFNEGMQLWEIEDDYRGALWYLKADGSLVSFALGDTPNLTTMTDIAKPSTNPELYVWDEGTTSWIYDLALTRDFQKRKVSTDANANLQTLLADGLNTVLDVVAYAFARIDGFNYQSAIPATIDVTLNTNVALSGSTPGPGGVAHNDVVLLTGQTVTEENGYYTYDEGGGSFTFIPFVMPSTPFYEGVKNESASSFYDAHQAWNNPSGGAAGYLGIFAERKRALIEDIDAASTGPDILALNWTNF